MSIHPGCLWFGAPLLAAIVMALYGVAIWQALEVTIRKATATL